MNFLIVLFGKCYLLMEKCGEKLRSEQYRKKLLSCGENVRISAGCKLTPERIRVGNNVVIGDNACIMATKSMIYIGNHVIMGRNVTIRGGDHRIDIIGYCIDEINEKDKSVENDQDVCIEDDVWIGDNVIILKGVNIGTGCVLGAGTVVTKDVMPYTVHVGVHQPYEKRRFTEAEIKKHKQMLNERNTKTDNCIDKGNVI